MAVLVGRRAPDFVASAVLADGTIVDDFKLLDEIDGHYGVLFFYPLDFTFVCPSEIIAMDNRVAALEGLNAKVIGVSIDSQYTHVAFRNTPIEKGGIGPVKFPLVADTDHRISTAYGIQSDGGESFYDAGVAMRATFIIDHRGVVRHQVVNDEPVGRNMDETIRVIEALQHHETNGRVCPAGWKQGDEGMTPTSEGVSKFLGQYWSDL
jgi:peroxiredoxin (alkyl hydroperoxide reductase subunit C)